MWTYSETTGLLSRNTQPVGLAYSGAGSDKNNPNAQDVPNCGPIPQGLWHIGPATDATHLGPVAMPLTPDPTTNTQGRSGFWIHGDSIRHPGQGSHGCIVAARTTRETIRNSQDTQLTVTP